MAFVVFEEKKEKKGKGARLEERKRGQARISATLNNVEFRSTLPSDDTFYAYDAAGNRIRERFTKGGVNYQDATIGYDALGRMTQVHDNTYTMRYDYDANGNRRRAQSSYYDENNVLKNVDNWYLYDGMNRITLSQGVLSAGTILINNDQGVQLAYDAAGNRRTATTMESGVAVSESYSYDANNRLVSTARNGSTTSLRSYDLAGKVTEQSSFSSPGTLSERRTSSYDANGRVTEQNVYNSANTHTQRTQYTAYDGVGNNTSYQVQVLAGTAYTNYYTTSYAKFDGYKESQVAGSSTWFQAGATTSSYDRNGNLTAVSETFATSKNRSFVTDQAGSILRKTENGKTQNYFYAGDKPLGSSGALSGADFDFNYTPVSEQFPGTVPGNYVVSSGDTLRGIALSLFGDAQLWYLIADANGLKSDADLQVGKNLTVPNKVTNLRNAADTYKPYAPGRIIGDTRPTLPDPPPPPAQSSDDGGCGGIGAILVAVVAVVAVVMTAGVLLAPAVGAGSISAGGLGAAWAAGLGGTIGAGSIAVTAGLGTWGVGMIAGAVGSIASQAVGMAVGMQSEFSWSGVAMGAIGGGVSAGLGATGMNAIGRAVVGSVITQGIGVVTGMQQQFSWSGVAAAGVGAGVGQAVGNAVFGDNSFARDLTVGLASSVARQMVSGGKVNWANVAADAFGNAIGNSQGYRATAVGNAEQVVALINAEDQAYVGGAGSGSAGYIPDEFAYDAGPWIPPEARVRGAVYHEDSSLPYGQGRDRLELSGDDGVQSEAVRRTREFLNGHPQADDQTVYTAYLNAIDAERRGDVAVAYPVALGDGVEVGNPGLSAARATTPEWSFREASRVLLAQQDAQAPVGFRSGSYASLSASPEPTVRQQMLNGMGDILGNSNAAGVAVGFMRSYLYSAENFVSGIANAPDAAASLASALWTDPVGTVGSGIESLRGGYRTLMSDGPAGSNARGELLFGIASTVATGGLGRASGLEGATNSADNVLAGRGWKTFGDNEIFTQRVEWTATRPRGTGQTYPVIQRNDIDWTLKRTDGTDDFIGKTNAEAARKGYAPQLGDSNFATLHHVGQDSRGALAEASSRYHGVGKPGQDALHSLYGKKVPHPVYPIDRRAFAVDTREYWMWRIENQ